MEYYLVIKIAKILSFVATWMDLEIAIMSEVHQTQKDISYDITFMWNQKKGANRLIYKIEAVTNVKNKFMG